MTISDVTLREMHAPARVKLYRRFGKRVFDILFTLAAAPLILPLVAVFALLIRKDGGPVFFSQKRIGKDGREFNCFKLRTMVVNAEKVLADMCEKDPELAEEWHTYQKLSKDPRITRVGNILRKTSLDELPQFWNVFIGDMSIIGPRPFMPEQEALYSTDKSAAYFKLRPGITGSWQVSSRNDSTFVGRREFDESYLRDLSLMGDIKYVFKTVSVMVASKGK